jgi:DNA-directed RNA polymerase subunit RPC12/RpoP
LAYPGLDPIGRLRPGKGVIVVFNKPYRGCPVCRSGLSELMKRKENGQDWEVYECSNCGSEVWVVPFKRVREGIR